MSLEAITQLHGWSHDTFTNASSRKFLRVESCYPERFVLYASLLAFFPLMLLLMLFCVCLLELKRYFLEVIHIHRCYLYSAVPM